MKRFAAVTVAILMLLFSLVSCSSNKDVPDGMVLASLPNEPFKLFVPDDMTLNTSSGISSAFSYAPEKCIISARYYTPEDPEMTLDGYMDYCADRYSKSLEAFVLVSRDPSVLSGADAVTMVYAAKIASIDYTCTQISAKHNGDMVSLNFYFPTSIKDNFKDSKERITEEFILCDKPEAENDEYVDKKTPEGMKIASNDKLEYRLYVPKTWVCNSQSEKSEAYYPESGRSNINVTSFSPESAITLDEYITSCEADYSKVLKEYESLNKTAMTIDDKEAAVLNFKTTYDGVTILTRQYFANYSGLFYTITYTATEENFELHVKDVEKIIEEFDFR